MIVLGIESATARAGVAIGTGGGVVASAEVTRGPRHAEILVPAVKFVCEQAGIDLSQVTAIAVDIGPGLFTGLRVGIATANGLAQALGIPMIGVSSLDLLAYPLRFTATNIVSIIDARRSEVYLAQYKASPDFIERVGEPEIIGTDAIAGALSSVAGLDGIAAGLAQVSELLAPLRDLAPQTVALPSAQTLVEIAVTLKPVDPSAIAPLYLRKSDAELNADRKGL